MSEPPSSSGEWEAPQGAPREQPAGDQTLTLPADIVPPSPLEKEHAGLVVIQGREIGRVYRLRRRNSILGRGEDATLRIEDDLVSRQHASLEVVRAPGAPKRQILLADLGSTNRTYVNGNPIIRVELKEGDKIQVGDTVLKFVLQDELDARFHQEVHQRITYDQLTGLLSKESLYLALASELKRCLRYGLPLSVLMMDLDRFKQVNDTYGHLMGSHVLAEVGRLVRQGFRSTDVSGRYGGEEFMAYLAEVSTEQALIAAERIRSAIEAHPFTRQEESGRTLTLRITISIGVSRAPRDGKTLEALVAAADAALYRAKAQGRNRVCVV